MPFHSNHYLHSMQNSPQRCTSKEVTRRTASKSPGLSIRSVSCYTIREDPHKTLCLLKKHQPPASLAAGIIRRGTGLWAHTNDWSVKKGNSHVDWWIFAGMASFTDFEVV